jgi:hypothetical protein
MVGTSDCLQLRVNLQEKIYLSWSCEYLQVFEKILNGPYGILRGLGETDS